MSSWFHLPIHRHPDEPTGGGAYTPPPPNYHYPQSKPKMSTGVKILIVLGVLGALFTLVVMASIMSLANLGAELSSGLNIEGGDLSEVAVTPAVNKSPDKIAIITIAQPITGDGSHVSGEGLVQDISRQFRKVIKDKNVKGVLLQMDSPGGGLAASDILHEELIAVQKAGKPVVVAISSLAASGGYYISCPADYIIAAPTALVGSIGVIMQHIQITELMKKLGIQVNPIKSSDSKDIGSPFRPMTPAEEAYFKGLIDTFYNRFVKLVAEGRKLDEAAVRKIADGRIYTAEEALSYKLIDEVGYFDRSVEKVKELTKAPDAALIKYEKGFDFKSFLKRLPGGQGPWGGMSPEELWKMLMIEAATPQVMAVWRG